MKHLRIPVLMAAAAMLTLIGAMALAVVDGDKGRSLRARLKGLEELPVVLTGARGTFRATVAPDDSSIEYELSYENLEGTVTQGHIHVAQRMVNGGISVWLCGTATNPGPAGTPVCPSSGTVKGTITAATVVGPAGQGVAPGEFATLLQAIRRGLTYANVHSTLAPGGEIRGQITVKRDDDDDDHDHHHDHR